MAKSVEFTKLQKYRPVGNHMGPTIYGGYPAIFASNGEQPMSIFVSVHSVEFRCPDVFDAYLADELKTIYIKDDGAHLEFDSEGLFACLRNRLGKEVCPDVTLAFSAEEDIERPIPLVSAGLRLEGENEYVFIEVIQKVDAIARKYAQSTDSDTLIVDTEFIHEIACRLLIPAITEVIATTLLAQGVEFPKWLRNYLPAHLLNNGVM